MGMIRLKDTLNRDFRDMRISVTDRCNFRCTYCMPKEVFNKDYQFLQRTELLSFEEILRVIKLFTSQGLKKVRLTGGEPLIRKNIETLIEHISGIDDIQDLSITTNASLLDISKARNLKDAGLSRITISLDALNEEMFQNINNTGVSVKRVLQGIDNAMHAGFETIKVNMVVKRSANLSEVMPLVRYFRNTGCILRFIEYMDVGITNQWQLKDVVPVTDLIEMINAEFPIEPISPNYKSEVAKRWRYKDGCGEIGFITSISQPFCRNCSRLRMSAKGEIYTCLFASKAHDIRRLLREGHNDEEIIEWLRNIWSNRDDRYSELRNQQVKPLKKAEMSYIGG